MINIVDSDPFDSRFKKRITYKEIDTYCDITYSSLTKNPSERDLILINGNSDLGRLLRKDNPKLDSTYQELLNRSPSICQAFFNKERPITKIELIKQIVNEIEKGNVSSDVAYAIHKFGYVPVVISDDLAESYTDINIGIYPQDKEENSRLRKRLKYPPGVKSDIELLKSIAINPFNLFRKYLEDIGEYLYLIEHTSEIDNIFKYGKIIEEIKGESIQSKLRVIKQNTEKKPQATKDLTAYLFSHPAVFMAEFGRELSMLLVNEIYSIVGLADRIDEYHERIYNLKVRYEKNRKNPEWSPIIKGIDILFKTIYEYHKLDVKENLDRGIELMEIFPNKESWGRRFGEFLLFTSVLKTEGSKNKSEEKCTTPRLFISHHHNVDSSENLLSKIEEHSLTKAKYNSVVPLKLNDKRDDYIDSEVYHHQFKRFSRSLIWLSDEVIVIIPKKANGKNYKWLYREIEHSLLKWGKSTSKRIIYLQEDQVSDNDFLSDLDDLKHDYLSVDFRKSKDERLKIFFDHYSKEPKFSFEFKPKGPLETKIQDRLKNTYDTVPIQKSFEILKGYISQFNSETTHYNNIPNHGWLIMLLVVEAKEDEVSVDQISLSVKRILQEKENKFSDQETIIGLINNIKNQMMDTKVKKGRKLKINDLEIPIISFTKGGKKLKGNLIEALKIMLPNSTAIERLEIQDKLYSEFLQHLRQ
jgi:hypothetical protein